MTDADVIALERLADELVLQVVEAQLAQAVSVAGRAGRSPFDLPRQAIRVSAELAEASRAPSTAAQAPGRPPRETTRSYRSEPVARYTL